MRDASATAVASQSTDWLRSRRQGLLISRVRVGLANDFDSLVDEWREGRWSGQFDHWADGRVAVWTIQKRKWGWDAASWT